MASTYTSDLRLNKQGIGDNNNTWGTVVNTQLDLLDNAISGTVTVNVTTGSNVTLTTANGTSDEARNMVIKMSGTPTANINIIVPAVSKLYIIDATDLAGSFGVTVKPTAGTGVQFTAGQTGVVTCDGTDVIEIFRSTTSFVSGMIMMWSGTIASIPTGWVLCNGSNTSPDLRDKFIVGARQDSGGVAMTNLTGSLTQSGGSLTTSSNGGESLTSGSTVLTTAQIPAHTHTMGFQAQVQGQGGGTGFNGSGSSSTLTTSSTGGGEGHTHTVTTSNHTHTATPPYFALAYIMKT